MTTAPACARTGPRPGGQAGFSLIELVIVVVVLGILSTVALPRFTGLTERASQASTDGIAGALSTAASTNFANRSSGSGGVAVANCTDVAALILGGLPAGYTIASAAAPAGVAVSCTLNGPNASSASFTGIGT